VLGHVDSKTARFFDVLAARFYLFCFMNKYDSRSCFFLSTSMVASSRVCWDVHNCLEQE